MTEQMKRADGTGRLAKRRIKYPLVVKMIGIISIIVVVAMATITSIASWFFSEESLRARGGKYAHREPGFGGADRRKDRVDGVGGAVASGHDTRERGQPLDRAGDGLELVRPERVGRDGRSARDRKKSGTINFFRANELDQDALSPFMKVVRTAHRPGEGRRKTLVSNASPAVGIPAAALFMPYRDMGTKNALVIVFSTEEFQTMVQTNPTGVNYVVGWDGSLIVHPDFDLVKMGANFSRPGARERKCFRVPRIICRFGTATSTASNTSARFASSRWERSR